MPGRFTRGQFVPNDSATEQGTAGSKFITRGWHRLTTGTGHVAGTDWVPERVLTGN